MRGLVGLACPPKRGARRRVGRVGLTLAAAMFVFGGAAPAKLVGGNGTLYIGGWPNKVFVID